MDNYGEEFGKKKGSGDSTSAHEIYRSITDPVEIQRLLDECRGKIEDYGKQAQGASGNKKQKAYENLQTAFTQRAGELEKRLDELLRKDR